MVKHVTATQFMWATYDKDGKVTRAAGGDYTLKGEVYEETPEYGISSDFDEIKGKAQTFKWKVEGNKWHHNGKLSNGLSIEEVWGRVGSNSAEPLRCTWPGPHYGCFRAERPTGRPRHVSLRRPAARRFMPSTNRGRTAALEAAAPPRRCQSPSGWKPRRTSRSRPGQ